MDSSPTLGRTPGPCVIGLSLRSGMRVLRSGWVAAPEFFH
nr:MAG TPA: hypothetical protein [Caudoviricetes sp.]